MSKDALIDFVAGSVGGFAAKLLDYPLDTVKVLLQTQAAPTSTSAPSGQVLYRGAWDCLYRTAQTKGFISLYKGISAPLLGCMTENAVLFWAYGHFRSLMGETKQRPLSITELSVAGAGAGGVVSFVLTPIELVKCRMQVQNATTGATFRAYKSPVDVIAQTYRQEGVRGFYRGHLSTMYREVPGNFCYFATYELVCNALVPEGGSRTDLGPSAHLTGGIASGVAYWTAFYPADCVKSLIQTRADFANKSFLEAFKTIYRTEGIAGLYRGWGITVARGAPGNALVFAGYEYVSKLLHNF